MARRQCISGALGESGAQLDHLQPDHGRRYRGKCPTIVRELQESLPALGQVYSEAVFIIDIRN